jgi:hypothetical protein
MPLDDLGREATVRDGTFCVKRFTQGSRLYAISDARFADVTINKFMMKVLASGNSHA